MAMDQQRVTRAATGPRRAIPAAWADRPKDVSSDAPAPPVSVAGDTRDLPTSCLLVNNP